MMALNQAAAPAAEAASARTQVLLQANARTLIESGFDQLYRLKFAEARNQFVAYQQAHPLDPLGDVSIAASYLFEEFYHQQVLTSKFFLNDKLFLGGIEGRPDEGHKVNFNRANQHARELARNRLKSDPDDADAFFALTMSAGMQADYASILERQQFKSLGLIREANEYAKQLLKLRPKDADAWLALGAANYIIGCLPAHVRFFLWFGRLHGDKRLGMEQLRKAAEEGHYLMPFSKIFLALAAMREGQEDLARQQFSDLVARFPDNPLFAEELARLNSNPKISP
jgi:tetratricopeptide (TPR) repeat protein